MHIKCTQCEEVATIRKNHIVAMTCYCFEDFRLAPLSEIIKGFHKDYVYLYSSSESINYDYKQKKSQRIVSDVTT